MSASAAASATASTLRPLPRTAHCRLTSNTLHPQAAAAIAVAHAARSYGLAAGVAYCKRLGIKAPAPLVRLASQLAAAKRAGF